MAASPTGSYGWPLACQVLLFQPPELFEYSVHAALGQSVGKPALGSTIASPRTQLTSRHTPADRRVKPINARLQTLLLRLVDRLSKHHCNARGRVVFENND